MYRAPLLLQTRWRHTARLVPTGNARELQFSGLAGGGTGIDV